MVLVAGRENELKLWLFDVMAFFIVLMWVRGK